MHLRSLSHWSRLDRQKGVASGGVDARDRGRIARNAYGAGSRLVLGRRNSHWQVFGRRLCMDRESGEGVAVHMQNEAGALVARGLADSCVCVAF